MYIGTAKRGVERNGQRDRSVVEAVSFQPSVISRLAGRTA